MSKPSNPESDRNLLFGVLAVQLNFISRDDLVTGMNSWVLHKEKSLGQILLEQGKLSSDQVAALDGLIVQHLKMHEGNAERSLRAIPGAATVASGLTPVNDDDVQRSIMNLGGGPSTRTYHPAPVGTRYRRGVKHAEGGQGIVYAADETELGREVALKELKPEYADIPEYQQRFAREAQITGGLGHPGFVPVYGFGHYDNGQPYYAMRLIRGETLRDAIVRFHVEDKSGRRTASERRLVLHQLLRRFIDVCNAVAYAHSRGVLHRDVKPANVMLGSFGETIVLDLGLAKPHGVAVQLKGTQLDEAPIDPKVGADPERTQPGFLGTAAYASPEQAAGRLDLMSQTSDVYSLGATLYTLLTGEPAFRSKDHNEILEKVRQGDFKPPIAVKPDTPPALNAICLKAMALDMKDRYQSAQDLAADVEHWLADEAVGAHRESMMVRVGRWARRHQKIVVGTTASLAAGLLVALGGAALVWAEQQETEKQRKNAVEGKQIAQQNYKLSRDQTFQIVDLIETSEADIAANPGLHDARKKILALAATACTKYLTEEDADTELRRRSAQVFRYTANVHRLTNDIESAEPLYQKSLVLYEGLAKDTTDSPEYLQRISETLRDQAKLQSNVGRLAEAAKTLDRAVQIAEKLDQESSQHRRTLATALLNVASLEFTRGNYQKSQEAAATAVDLFTKLAALPDGQRHGYDEVLCSAGLNIGAICQRELGQIEQAIQAHKEPVKRLARLTKQPPKGVAQPDAVNFYSLFLLAQCRTRVRSSDLKQRDFAEKALFHALTNLTTLATRFPAVPMYRESLGEAYQVRGRLSREEAERWREAGAQLMFARVFPTDLNGEMWARQMTNFRFQQAHADLLESEKLLAARVKEAPKLPIPHGDLGRTYLEMARLTRSRKGKAADIARFLDQAVKELETASALYSRQHKQVENSLAEAHKESK